MISDTNQFIFLQVPLKWTEIYNKLLILMSNKGIDMIKDCNAACDENGKRLIECWNEFNAACAAYANGQEKEAKILITILIDCMNKKYKTDYDVDYYTNFDISTLPTINCNNSTFFIPIVIAETTTNNFNDFASHENIQNANQLYNAISNIINNKVENYYQHFYDVSNTKYIVNDDGLIMEDIVYDDLYIIRLSKEYTLKKINYEGGFGENIIYDSDNNINNNLFIFENYNANENVYIYYNNDKTFYKNIKIELKK